MLAILKCVVIAPLLATRVDMASSLY